MVVLSEKLSISGKKSVKPFTYYDEQTGEYIETTFNHLELPDSLTHPVIDGVERTMNLGITRAPGWHYADGAMLFIPAYRKVKGQSLMFSISFRDPDKDHPRKEGLRFDFKGSRSFDKIPLADLFNVVFNISDPDELRSLIGVNTELLSSKYIKKKKGKDLIHSIKHKNLPASIDLTHKLKSMMTTQTKLESPDRLYDILSLRHFIGCSLAEDTMVGNTYYRKFTVLDEALAFEIEHSGLDSVKLITESADKINVVLVTQLYCNLRKGEIPVADMRDFAKEEVLANKFIFNGKAYSKEGAPEHNTLLIYAAIINRLFAFETAGINFSMQDFRNQTIVTFEDEINDYIREDLDIVQNKIYSTDNLLMGVSNHHFDTGRVIRKIKNAESAKAVKTKNENPLAATSQGQVLVRDVKRLSKEAVRVLPQDLGMTDPVDTAESENLGKTIPLTMTTKVDDRGELVTELYKVVDGKVTNQIDKVHVSEIPNLFIAEEGVELKGNVLARHQNLVKLFPASRITHVRVSPFSTTSACRGSAVFIENTDQKRTQMTANAQKQARTILRPDRALIETGIEAIAANGGTGIQNKFSVEEIFETKGITPKQLEGHRFSVKEVSNTGTNKEFVLTSTTDPGIFVNFNIKTEKSYYGSSYYWELVAPSDLTEFYQPKDIVYRHHNVVLGGNVEGTTRLDYHTKGDPDYFQSTIANGKDLFVMFGFSEAYTVDDASVMSDRLVRDMSLATPVIVTKKYSKGKIFKANLEEHFGCHKGEVHEGFAENGLPLVGTYLRPGTHWLYAYTLNTDTGQKAPRNQRLKSAEHGEVIAVHEDEEEIKVVLAKWVQVEVGDKFSGRHGNKTIISKVMPAEMMPYDPATGRHIDMIINPLGIPSRGNISQLAELQKAAEVKARGLDSKIIPPFSNELMKMVENYDQGKELTEIQLINPQTGLYYPKKHFCGYMHYLRNAKISEQQLHSVGDSTERDSGFAQPVGGDLHEKGQSISSMEKEILVSYGASGILDEIHSILSVDRLGFNEVAKIYVENPDDSTVEFEGYNEQNLYMQHAILSFHLSVKQKGDKVSVDYLSDEDMERFVVIPSNSTHDKVNDMLTNKDYLETVMTIPFGNPFLTPIAIRKFSATSMVVVDEIDRQGKRETKFLGKDLIEKIIMKKSNFTVTPVEGTIPSIVMFDNDIEERHLEKHHVNGLAQQTGMLAICKVLEDYPMELWLNHLKALKPNSITDKTGNYDEDHAKRVARAEAHVKSGGFKKFITHKFPVLPSKYRTGDNELSSADSLTTAFVSIATMAKTYGSTGEGGDQLYKHLIGLMLPSNEGKNRISLYEFWAKKDMNGRIRGRILKTRVLCSMRSTIVPMFSGDPAKHGYPEYAGHPDSIGLPLAGALRIAQPKLIGYLKAYHKDILNPDYSDIDNVSRVIDILTLPIDSVEEITGWETSTIAQRVRDLKKEIVDFINKDSYVFYGRAPSLHETSLRGARVYVHDEQVIHLHSLLTTDLNADHDGDQVYVVMPVTKRAQEDIKEKLLPSTNALRYNDGKPSLAISQDALLGLFFATAEPSGKSAIPINSIEQGKYFLKLGRIEINDLVVLNVSPSIQIKTTLGRLIANGIIYGDFKDSFTHDVLRQDEDGFYTPPYNDQISGKSMSNIQLQIAKDFTTSPKLVTDIYTQLQSFGYLAAEMRNLTVGIKDLTPVLKVDSINKEVKKHIEVSRTLEELGLLPEDYLDTLDNMTREQIKKLNIMDLVPEDNAFRILADSGAKGKAAGIEKMFGVQGFIGGSDGTPLATPLLTNTVRGLSQFQVEDLSYTQRDNALSTVFETSKPGETLRSGAFSLSGLIVQENNPEDEHMQLAYYEKRYYSKEVYLGPKRSEAKVVTEALDYHYKGEPLTASLLRKLSFGDKPSITLDEPESYLFFSNEKETLTWVGTDRETAVEGRSFEDFHYKGQELNFTLVQQLKGCQRPHLRLDEEGYFLFFDVVLHPFASEYFANKMDLNGKRVTDRDYKKMVDAVTEYLPLATHANEFSVDYGISQKHAGFRAGSIKPYRVGQNIGIKSSTAAAQPANQLVISKRNMDRAAGLDDGIEMFKYALQNGRYYQNIEVNYELLSPVDGVVRIRQTPKGTNISIEGYNGVTYRQHVKANAECLFTIKCKDGDLVFVGQTILAPASLEDGERRVHPTGSFSWEETQLEYKGKLITFKDKLINPSRDLVQLVRFYVMVYLESIYKASGISLDPNHYGSFALQQARFCSVLLSDTHDIGYLNINTYLDTKAPDTVVEFRVLGATKTIMLTAGPITAICYRDAINVGAAASMAGDLPEFGSLSKVILGMSLETGLGDKQVIEELKGLRKVADIKQAPAETPKEDKPETNKSFIGALFGKKVVAPTSTPVPSMNTSNLFGGGSSTQEQKPKTDTESLFGSLTTAPQEEKPKTNTEALFSALPTKETTEHESTRTQIADQQRSNIFGGGDE